MLVGSSQMTGCCLPWVDNGQNEPPVMPFTQAELNGLVTTTMSYNFFKEGTYTWESSGSNCCVTSGSEPSGTSQVGAANVNVVALSKSKIDFNLNTAGGSPGYVMWGGNNGKYYREEDDVLVAQGIQYIQRRYEFYGAGDCGVSPEQLEVYSPTWETCGCLGCIPDGTTLNNVSSGDLIPVTCDITFYVYYLGSSTYDIPGVQLGFTALGSSLGPWKIETNGESIVLTSNIGTVFEYNGLLSQVVAQINSDGYFLAAVSSYAAPDAETKDLQPSVQGGNTNYSSPCSLILVSAGTVLAPSSTASGVEDSFSSVGFTRSSGFPDNEDGFIAWLNSAFQNPTASYPIIKSCYGAPYCSPVSWDFHPPFIGKTRPTQFYNTGGGESSITENDTHSWNTVHWSETVIVFCNDPVIIGYDSGGDPICGAPEINCPGGMVGPQSEGHGCYGCQSQRICGFMESDPCNYWPPGTYKYCQSCVGDDVSVVEEEDTITWTKSVEGSVAFS